MQREIVRGRAGRVLFLQVALCSSAKGGAVRETLSEFLLEGDSLLEFSDFAELETRLENTDLDVLIVEEPAQPVNSKRLRELGGAAEKPVSLLLEGDGSCHLVVPEQPQAFQELAWLAHEVASLLALVAKEPQLATKVVITLARLRKRLRWAFPNVSDWDSYLRDAAKTQQLVAIGELASGVAHEINNPLTASLNFVDIIREDVETGHAITADSEDFGFLGEIRKEAERISLITSNLLKFARGDEAGKVPTDVAVVLENSLSLLSYGLRRDGINLVTNFKRGACPSVSMNESLMQQAFVNLLLNARWALNAKYQGFHRDKIVEVSAKLVRKLQSGVSAEVVDWKNLSEESLSSRDLHVRVTILDHGIGLPERDLPKIFEPFFSTRTDAKDRRRGMGLSIVREIVNKHGGQLTVETKEGQFFRVMVDLPLNPP
ncbi:MAG: hypothetical protein Kow0069_31180 [Promethearchaeota archaeon]